MFAQLSDRVMVGDSILVEIPGWLSEQGIAAVVYVAPRGSLEEIVPIEFDYCTMQLSADEILAHELGQTIEKLNTYKHKEFPTIVGKIFICSHGGLNLAPIVASYCFDIPYDTIIGCYSNCMQEITRVRTGTNRSLGKLLASANEYDYRITELEKAPPRSITFTSHKNILTNTRRSEINWAAAR